MTTPEQVEIPPPSPDDVLYERRGAIGWVTLNRPVVLNAVNWSIMRRLMVALERAEADEDALAIILHGAGRAFCAGGDVTGGRPDDDDPIPDSTSIALKIWSMPKPFVAAVHGYAVGQGYEFAGVCDLTVAAADAKFGEIQIRHGFGLPILITPFLLGLKKAKETVLLGEMIDAQEAHRLGIVNRLVPPERLLDEAEAIATRLASLPQKVIRMNKLLVNRAYELAGFREALLYRDDPALAAGLAAGAMADRENPHLQVLRSQGWEAFKRSRDAMYRSEEGPS
ncbi:MAG: enoyl-CoA hydratase/isomerase family protein [Dehalococcoidia bacterium]